MMMAMIAVTIPLMSGTADAQTRSCRRYSNNYSSGYSGYDGYTTTYQRPSFYRRHRNLVNVGIGTGAGALIGGLIGGGRGAGWGALAGAGAGALYTYKIKPKQRRYYYYR